MSAAEPSIFLHPLSIDWSRPTENKQLRIAQLNSRRLLELLHYKT
jgi:hypothetical protein